MLFIYEPQLFKHTRISSYKLSWKICSTNTTVLICMCGGDSTEVLQLVAHLSSLILGSFCQHVAWLQSAPELWEVKTRFREAGHGKPLYTMKETYSVEGLWSTMSGCWQLLTACQCEESQFEVFDHVHNHYCSFCNWGYIFLQSAVIHFLNPSPTAYRTHSLLKRLPKI